MCYEEHTTYPIRDPLLGKLKARIDNDVGAKQLTFPNEWERIQLQESPAIRRRIRSRLGGLENSLELIYDAEQETWLLMYRKIDGSYLRPDLHRSYLFWQARAAVTKIFRDVCRNRKVVAVNPEDDIMNFIEAKADLFGTQFGDELDALIKSQLTVSERELLVLRILEGKTFDEIGRELKRPRDTVYGAYVRALKKIRDGMGDSWEDFFPE